MIESKALWFARADKLGDDHEGSIPAFDDSGLDPAIAEQMAGFRKAVRKILYVNCWTASDDESVAMWNLYSGLTSGIAIRATVGDLIASLEPNERTLHVAYVQYIDYSIVPPGSPDRNDLYTWYFRKRRSFRHEEEIRAIAHQSSDLSLFNNDPDYETEPGILVSNGSRSSCRRRLRRPEISRLVPGIGRDHRSQVASGLGSSALRPRSRRHLLTCSSVQRLAPASSDIGAR